MSRRESPWPSAGGCSGLAPAAASRAPGGIRYPSKIDDLDCFAIFERRTVREFSRHTTAPDDPDVQQVAREFGIELG